MDMNDDTFETYRPMLFSIAYRMTGSVMEAEDMVQETYLRYQAMPKETIRSPKNFLGTVVTRLCINHLNSARVQRETYIGPWLPEPILTGHDGAYLPSPAQHIDEYESISMAFMVLLENLTPVERAVFLLREVFEYGYDEIAQVIGKNEAACRQLFSRAKKHIADNGPRFDSSPEAHRAMLDNFLKVCEAGDLDGIMNLLAEEVTLYADGGGKAFGAATRPVYGRENAAHFILGSLRFLPADYALEVAEINGLPAIIVRGAGAALGVLNLEIAADRVQVVRFIGNPDKLQRL
ncbi:MAG: RNA polymerase sigma-70 factor [Chloroflexi bacterium]|nr:MAG: RNA polymerase sigma-70 factor [Chloroflexota bacterium]